MDSIVEIDLYQTFLYLTFFTFRIHFFVVVVVFFSQENQNFQRISIEMNPMIRIHRYCAVEIPKTFIQYRRIPSNFSKQHEKKKRKEMFESEPNLGIGNKCLGIAANYVAALICGFKMEHWQIQST